MHLIVAGAARYSVLPVASEEGRASSWCSGSTLPSAAILHEKSAGANCLTTNLDRRPTLEREHFGRSLWI
ncbi:Hypothetical predicted protein [Cloeon dipterum]|uniref:Uncharacterized protein n=1 Tax=Cloeon dipterum TaxID=197152 RepID=A0A8S1DVT3_9INSE|nr:Hypothetical predicted protein [Cloeon dipterum]